MPKRKSGKFSIAGFMVTHTHTLEFTQAVYIFLGADINQLRYGP